MSQVYLASKPRYEILDGLRGVAALIVVAFHLFESYSEGPAFQILNHGYLAVDFFFVLSGFVIGYAYDDRWDRMTIGSFFKRRITRLHPMVVIGTIIGMLLFYFASSAFKGIDQVPVTKLMLLSLLGMFMIPVGKGLDIRGWGEGYPVNGPQWSLAFEYVANILYALVFRHLPKAVLGVMLCVFAFFTLDLCMHWDVFGLLGPHFYAANTVIGGWSTDPCQLYVGFTRLLYPFFCGLLISRVGKFITLRGGFWWCSLLLAVVLVLPHMGGLPKFDLAQGMPPVVDTSESFYNGIYCAAAILFIFPLIVMMGAGSKVTGTMSTKVCKFLGDISFPIYITHYPLIYIQMNWIAENKEAPLSVHIFVSVAIFLVAIAVAYGCLKLADEPIREWLKNHWLKSGKK